MGQTSSGSSGGHGGHDGQGGQNVAAEFGELLTPVGDWYLDQFVFTGPNAAPVQRTGRVTSRSLIGKAAIIAMFEVPSSGARFAAMVTFNPRSRLYELAIVDANSDLGLGLMVSESLNERAPASVRFRFGKSATIIREWFLVETEASLGGTAADLIIAILPAAAAAAGITEGSNVLASSMRITEILVNENRWVLQFFFTGPNGETILAAELVCTRVQPGCAPLVGCDLGCSGLLGCATGCEGFQSPTGMPMGQPQMMGQGQMMSQAQCGCATQTLGQVPGCQTLIGVAQTGCAQPLALPTPVVLAPQLCAPQVCAPTVCAPTVCAPVQTCPRQPVPPPPNLGEPERPGRPPGRPPGHGGGGHK